MNMKRIAVLFALAVAALTAPADFSARQDTPLKIQNKVQLAALPLSEGRNSVRLSSPRSGV